MMRDRIAVVDLETTGLGGNDTPCEIGIVELVSRRDDLAGRPTNWEVDLSGAWSKGWLVRPDKPIPPQASAVHHITDEDVERSATVHWRDGLRLLLADSPHVALVAHGADHEQKFFDREAGRGRPWICTWKCSLRLWPDAPGHSNQVLRYWLRPEGLDRALAGPARRAFPDAYVTAHLAREMLKLAPLDQLIAWSAEPALLVHIPLHNYRGVRWTEIDDGFLDWVLARDFKPDVMFTAAHERDRRRRERALGRDELDRLDDDGGKGE